jgi:hypothetical protein
VATKSKKKKTLEGILLDFVFEKDLLWLEFAANTFLLSPKGLYRKIFKGSTQLFFCLKNLITNTKMNTYKIFTKIG